MSFAKELLFSCIIMMHFSSVALQPHNRNFLEKMEDIRLSFCNLLMAEKEYVKLTSVKLSDSVGPPEGITLAVGNTTKEIHDSVCAISDYLENHLEKQLVPCFGHKQHKQLRDHVTTFLHQFKSIADLRKCVKRPVKSTDCFNGKKFGLRILTFSKRWVEQFTKISCD